MANHIAYYQVLSDNTTDQLPNLSPKQNVGGTAADEDVNTQLRVWRPAGDTQLNGDGSKRPVLCYNVDLNNCDSFHLRVLIRGKQGDKTISNFTFDGNTTRQFMDPFQLEWVRPDVNIFMFKLINRDGGNVIIRNAVIMYQRLINT